MNDTNIIDNSNNNNTSISSNNSIILYADSIYVLGSNNVADLSIFFVGLGLCLLTFIISFAICLNSQIRTCCTYCKRKRDINKLKKQKLPMKTQTYYENIKEYNGTSKFYANSQPILFVISSISLFFWYLGMGLYYNLLNMAWLDTEIENQVASLTSRRVYCICIYIWLNYILGSYLYSINIFGRVLSLFVYNIQFGRDDRVKVYRKKQLISLSSVLILSSLVICIGIVISIFIKFNTNGSNSEMNTITCNRMNSVGEDIAISQYDPNTLALVVLQYLLLGLVLFIWCLSFFASSKTCCSKRVPNALLRRFDFYWNMIVAIMFFAIVTEFNVVSFLYGFKRSDATLIQSIPDPIRYTNLLAMPIMEFIALIGYNYQLIITCLNCKWKSVKKFRIIDEIPEAELYEREKSKVDKSSTNNSSATNMSLNDSSLSTNSRNSLLMRHSMIAMELQENRHKYVSNPKNSIRLDEPLPFHGLENTNAGSRKSLKSNRSSIKSSNGSSTKRSDVRVHFVTLN